MMYIHIHEQVLNYQMLINTVERHVKFIWMDNETKKIIYHF